MAKTAIITGISGQDGPYLAKILLEKDYTVIGLVRSLAKYKDKNLAYLGIQKKVIIEECDILDMENIQHLVDKYEPDEIYNLAAQSSVGISFSQPAETMTVNIMSTLNFLEIVRKSEKRIRFYHASSSEMFGKVDKLPLTFKTTIYPISPYAVSKAAAYWAVTNYRDIYKVYACNGILFNHESYLRAPNFFIKKVLNHSIAISKGELDELRVGNIDVKRDFGYGPKYVEAMYLMLQQEKPRDYLVCSGQSVSLREIIEYVFKKLNIDKEKLVEDQALYRPSDIEDIYGDNKFTRETLDWDYDYSFFDVIDILLKEEEENYTGPI